MTKRKLSYWFKRKQTVHNVKEIFDDFPYVGNPQSYHLAHLVKLRILIKSLHVYHPFLILKHPPLILS